MRCDESGVYWLSHPAVAQVRNQQHYLYPVVTIVTQVIVDKDDPAFNSPTKPIGPFYTEEEAKKIAAQRGYIMREDAGRGWRRVVPSPMPRKIVELDSVRKLWDSTIVITCGGGGIPVIENEDGTLQGVDAVIDKDFAAELLAEQVDADILLILTAVEKVAIRYGKPDQEDLRICRLIRRSSIKEGHFAPGSMLPKVQAAMKFVRANPDKQAIITSLDKADQRIGGETGTLSPSPEYPVSLILYAARTTCQKTLFIRKCALL